MDQAATKEALEHPVLEVLVFVYVFSLQCGCHAAPLRIKGDRERPSPSDQLDDSADSSIHHNSNTPVAPLDTPGHGYGGSAVPAIPGMVNTPYNPYSLDSPAGYTSAPAQSKCTVLYGVDACMKCPGSVPPVRRDRRISLVQTANPVSSDR